MTTLVLELVGAQQAWGSRSRFTTRATELAPTKSGVIGLIASALGMPRDASLERFDGLRFGVRIDQPGRVERDFQTTRSRDGANSFPLSERYYLADAAFVVALEGEPAELAEYAAALRAPHYAPFLGRRAFPPSRPIRPTLIEGTLEEALAGHPWIASAHHRRRTPGPEVRLEVVRDIGENETGDHSRTDVPVSFDPRRRIHAVRDVVIDRVPVTHPDPPAHLGGGSGRDTLLGTPTDHDPETLLSDEEV